MRKISAHHSRTSERDEFQTNKSPAAPSICEMRIVENPRRLRDREPTPGFASKRRFKLSRFQTKPSTNRFSLHHHKSPAQLQPCVNATFECRKILWMVLSATPSRCRSVANPRRTHASRALVLQPSDCRYDHLRHRRIQIDGLACRADVAQPSTFAVLHPGTIGSGAINRLRPPRNYGITP